MANPKQYVITPSPDIDSRGNITDVTSEDGAHVGPAYPLASNEGAMIPFQETYGSFTESEIDYQIVRSGGIGSAEWVWKRTSDANDRWRGVGDIRNQTHLCNPFKELEGKRYCANLGMGSVVSKAHDRLVLFRRSRANNNGGEIMVAHRPLSDENTITSWKTYKFRPETYFPDQEVRANMWFVDACELDDGTIRMVGSTLNVERDLWDLHLFGSDDGGLTWSLLQKNIIDRWYNQFDKATYPYDVRNIHNMKMAASGSWIRVVWVGPEDGKFHTLISSDRGATWENPAPPPFMYMYEPWISDEAIDDANAPGHSDITGYSMAAYFPWMSSISEIATKGFAYATSIPNTAVSSSKQDAVHTRNPGRKNYFDLVPVGGSEGSFTMVFQARPTTQPAFLGGSNPNRCLYLASAVRESSWGVARIIAAPEANESGSIDGAWTNNNQQRVFQQATLTNCEIASVATPSWIYIFVFTTPGQTGGNGLNAGWGQQCKADGENKLFETFGYNKGYGAVWPSGRKASAPGAWGITTQKSGWKGYRVPRADPYGGAAQKLHVSDINGHLFPGAVGQGKMFVPDNIVMEWDGSGIVMMNGIGHNGAMDAYSNFQMQEDGAYGPSRTLGIESISTTTVYAQMCRYGFSYQRNVDAYSSDFSTYGKTALYGYMADVTDATDKYCVAYGAAFSQPTSYGLCVQKGRGRRGAFFDNPVEYEINGDGTYTATQLTQGRTHTAVTRWGGWDERPLVEPDGFDIGQSLCSPFFADTWQAQYGIPHYNPIGNAWTTGKLNYPARSGSSIGAVLEGRRNGATMMGFNIIGESSPTTGSAGLTLASGFIDTAQTPAFAVDTGLFTHSTHAEPLLSASASQWTVRANRKYSVYAGFTTSTGSSRSHTWPWTRVDRDMGNRTVDWESDRVTIRQNFTNSRTGNTGTNRDNMPIAFSTWRSAYGSREMAAEYVGSKSTLYYPDSFNEAYGGSLWGNSQYLYMEETKSDSTIKDHGYNEDLFADRLVPGTFTNRDTMRNKMEPGRPIPLGNGGIIEWACSVPHKGLRKGSGSTNPNVPFTHATTSSGDFGRAGNWRLAAVSLRYLTENKGYGTGGQLFFSEVCVAIGQEKGSSNSVAVVVDQTLWDIVDTSITKEDPSFLAVLNLGQDAFGSVESPIFWEFRLATYATYETDASNSQPEVRLMARKYGDSGPWIVSESLKVRRRNVLNYSSATQHEYKGGGDYGGDGAGWTKYPMQWCQWGKLDEQVTDSSFDGRYRFGDATGTDVSDCEYVSYWKSFNVAHPGTGGLWRQKDFVNPTSLSGMVCSPIPTYVYTGIFARWGGGGAFTGDTFNGKIDHTYAVENIFKPSPVTKWRSNTFDSGASTKPETSITLRAWNAGSTTKENYRAYANWIAFYGTQDRKFLVEFSNRDTFAADQTITYEANSLLTESADIQFIYDNHFELADPDYLIKDGEWAGCYAGFVLGGFYRTAVIRDNWRDRDHNRVTVALEPDTGNLDLVNNSLTGLGINSSYTVDVWSDRCAIDLYSDDQVKQIAPSFPTAESFHENGFNWMRIRFFGTNKVTTVGSTSYNIKKGYYTIDKQHTIGNMVVGKGTEFDVPVKWSHTESTKSNVKIRTAPSGQKLAYKQGPDRTTYSLNFPGDIEQFRYKLTNMLRTGADFDKKPIALLMNAQAATSDVVKNRVLRASKRYNVLARLKGAVTSQNVAWKKDSNGVWHTVGDMSLVFEEEV